MYHKALVIDDSDMDRLATSQVIRTAKFAEEVISCNSPIEALMYLMSFSSNPEQSPDVIFLDLDMPIMNGFQFLEKFQRLPGEITGNCSIIMASGTFAQRDFELAKRTPLIRHFLSKPLTVDTLTELLHTHL